MGSRGYVGVVGALLCGAQSKIWNTDGSREMRSRGYVGVVGAPSSDIELVLSKILFRVPNLGN
jgi:hypothetical protein